MLRRPPRSTRTDTLVPYTTLFRSVEFDDDIARTHTGISGRTALLDIADHGALGVLQADGLGYVVGDGTDLHTDATACDLAVSLQLLYDAHDFVNGARSDERRVGKEFVSTCRSRRSPFH